LLDSVRRVALVTDKTVPLRLIFNNNSLQLEAGAGEDAQATEELEIIYSGEPINIAFNPQYLTDGLQAIGTPFVQFNFTGASKPAVLTGKHELSGTRDISYQYLLMPMRYSA
jgi:DNA polymerase-3 subunit beta